MSWAIQELINSGQNSSEGAEVRGHQSKTFKTTSGYPPVTLQKPKRHSQTFSFQGYIGTDFQLGWWVGGWFLLQIQATSWSNLQICKISSRAEIPKLDTECGNEVYDRLGIWNKDLTHKIKTSPTNPGMVTHHPKVVHPPPHR